MKLMIVSSIFSSDIEMIEHLAQRAGVEVVTVTDDDLIEMRCARGPEARLQAFHSVIDGKQTLASEDDADWKTIDNLEHNKEIDSSI